MFRQWFPRSLRLGTLHSYCLKSELPHWRWSWAEGILIILGCKRGLQTESGFTSQFPILFQIVERIATSCTWINDFIAVAQPTWKVEAANSLRIIRPVGIICRFRRVTVDGWEVMSLLQTRSILGRAISQFVGALPIPVIETESGVFKKRLQDSLMKIQEPPAFLPFTNKFSITIISHQDCIQTREKQNPADSGAG